MGALFAYSLAVSLLLIPLYLTLRLMMQGLTFHRLYRAMLLSSVALSLLLPLLLPGLSDWIASMRTPQGSVVVDFPMVTAVVADAAPAEPSTPLWLSLLLIAYIVGVGVAFLWQSVRLVRLLRFVGSCRRVADYDRWTILVHDNARMSPFSWGRFIIISSTDYADCPQQVLLHEQAHLRGRHWLDLLCVSFVGTILWYNPVIWLTRSDLATIHEYEADSAVLASGADPHAYQLLLIKKAAGNRFHSIANSLDKSNISKRVKMMFKKQSMPVLRLRAALAIPVAVLAVAGLTSPVVANALQRVDDAKVTNISRNGQADATVKVRERSAADMMAGLNSAPEKQPLVVIDGKPTIEPNAMNSLNPDMIESITVLKTADATAKYVDQYPQASNGVIMIAMKQGADVEVAKSKGKTEEDVVVVGAGTMKKADATVLDEMVVVGYGEPSGSVVRVKGTTETDPAKQPLVLIDGKAVDYGELGRMPSSDIAAVTVLKDAESIARYSSYPAAKNGVLLVTTHAAGQAKSADAAEADADPIIATPEEMPRYGDSDADLFKFLAQNMRYPEEAVKNNEQGRVIVQFVVNTDCTVGDPKVVRSVSPSLDAEAIRVASLLKFKTPGKMKGKPVRVTYALPITFHLTKDEKEKPAK